jgi:hypothetical protein
MYDEVCDRFKQVLDDVHVQLTMSRSANLNASLEFSRRSVNKQRSALTEVSCTRECSGDHQPPLHHALRPIRLMSNQFLNASAVMI